MTPRDRILMTLAHERPDRVPTDGWFHQEIIAGLKKYFQCDDWDQILVKELGVEGWGHGGASVNRPEFAAKATTKWNRTGIWLDDNTYQDAWGVKFRVGERGRYEEWLSGPLMDAQSAEDVAKYPFPTVDDVVVPADLAERVAKQKAKGLFVTSGVENVFKRIWHLRGYENALMDYMEPEMLLAVYDRLFPVHTKLVTEAAKAGVEMITVVGDVSMQDRITMGAESWRKYDKPRYAKLIAEAKKIKKDIHFFFHSDGKLTELVDDLVEIGFDVINPIQPECMDPVEVKKRWGKKITLHGCISIQKTLPFGSAADVKAEVEGLIKNCGYDGGLILMPSNVIQPDTKLENVLTCYRTVRDFKW